MRSIPIASRSPSAQYVDRKSWAWALSPVWLCMPLMGIGLASVTGVGAWNWLTLAVWYLVLPVADYLIGADTNNPPESVIEQLEQASYYRILTYIAVPVHYGIFIVAGGYAAKQAI